MDRQGTPTSHPPHLSGRETLLVLKEHLTDLRMMCVIKVPVLFDLFGLGVAQGLGAELLVWLERPPRELA